MSDGGRIALAIGDITEHEVDAVVNAANAALQLGAGVAGAIRTRGGPEIQAECDVHGPIEVGAAAVTGAGKLPARYVIHAAGMPVGGRADAQSVRSALRHSLELARARGCKTLAVPAIGAGVGGLTLKRSAELLLAEARRHLEGETCIEEIRFVLFDESAYRVFEAVHDEARVLAAKERSEAPGVSRGR